MWGYIKDLCFHFLYFSVLVDVVTELSEEFEANVWIHQGSVLSPFLYFSVVVDVVTELACEGVLSELLYAEDLILMTEIIMGLATES